MPMPNRGQTNHKDRCICIAIDWHAEALPPAVLNAWSRLVDESVREFESSVVQAISDASSGNDFSAAFASLWDAKNLEDENNAGGGPSSIGCSGG